MFPRIRNQLLARLDLVVELSTLGEYGLAEDGSVLRLEPAVSELRGARRRGSCPAVEAVQCDRSATRRRSEPPALPGTNATRHA